MSLRGLNLSLPNSFLFPSLSNEVQVPEGAFSAVRELGDIAARLELDCLHPAITSEHHKQVVDIIKKFRVNQPSLITDKIVRDSISKQLHSARTTMAFVINRSNMNILVRDAKQMQPKEEVKS